MFFRWKNRASKQLSNRPKVRHLASDIYITWTQIQIYLNTKPVFFTPSNKE